MNIQPINNSITMQGKPLKSLKDRVMQKAIDAVPEHTVKESAKKLENGSILTVLYHVRQKIEVSWGQQHFSHSLQ